MIADDIDFFKTAIDISFHAGLTTTFATIYYNISSTEFIFNHAREKERLNREQRNYLKQVHNISRLYVIDKNVFETFLDKTIGVFSLVLDVPQKDRSVATYDIHSFFHKLTDDDVSIIFIKNKENLLVSIKSSDSECYLSDWYCMNDVDELIDRLSIYELDIDSIKSFFHSLLYRLVRSYYFNTYDFELLPYILIPDRYFIDEEIHSRHNIIFQIKNIVDDILSEPKKEYSYDYISFMPTSPFIQYDQIEINEEDDIILDLEYLKLEEIEKNENDQNNHDDHEEYTENEFENYDYDIEQINPKIFSDPERMLRWLNEHDE